MARYLITKIDTFELKFEVEADSLEDAMEMELDYNTEVTCEEHGHPSVSYVDSINGECRLLGDDEWF